MISKPVFPAWRPATLALALLLCALPATALYKVVQPDGTVTYTDRPPTDNQPARVTPMNASGTPQAAESGLPLELRRAAARHPVTLYTTEDCAPCDSGRKLLQQRGVPYTEKRIATDEDTAALERLVGGRSVPALTIGAQPLRGYSATDWATYLDAAGYPRTSKLPRDWPTPTATPLTERAAVQPAASAPAASANPPQAAPPQPSTGIRF